jgi:S1-C subfamily serine protease
MKKEKSQVIKTIARVMPAVVTIVIKKKLEDVKKDIEAARAHSGDATSFPDILSIPKEKVDARGMVQVDGGSGFIVDRTGIILTNKHVVSEPNGEYTIITSDNEEYEAELLARDPVDDIAILKISPGKKLPFVEFGDSLPLSLGQTVLAFGNALGIFKNTVSMGIISGLFRSITAYPNPQAAGQEMRGLIQTDAAINPGNSGGPLTDIFGRVIGINAAIISDAENIGLAIPISAAARDLHDLKKYGKIRRPLLGVHFTTLSKDLIKKLNLPVEYGAIILRDHPMQKAVIPESPADIGGIIENDVILTWNGEILTPEKNILDFLESSTVGEKVTLVIFRDGEEIEREITLGERK